MNDILDSFNEMEKELREYFRGCQYSDAEIAGAMCAISPYLRYLRDNAINEATRTPDSPKCAHD